MPPKKQDKAKDKAKLEKNKQKVDDKTFGLKNKNKSVKVQQFVKQMQHTVEDQARRKNLAADPAAKKDKKKAEEERQKELAELFAVAIKQPKVPPGVDPKSIVCEYYKAGQCAKGFKCKFSHDLKAGRKGGKASAFEGEGEGEEREGGMEEWDQAKLEEVVAQKHGAEGGNANKETKIICKFFLEALEKKQFWQCPNGKDCQYKHALPPGYMLKSQMKELLEAEAANAKSVEEEIEEARAKVEAKTPITEAVFQTWRKAQEEKRAAERERVMEERRKKGLMTGREIFAEEGFVVRDDEGATDAYEREDDEEEAFRQAAADAEAEAQRRRAEAGLAGGLHVGDQDAGPSSSAGPANGHSHPDPGEGPSSGPRHGLSAAEAAAVFEGSDDEELGDEEDLSGDELDALEDALRAKASVGD